MNQSLKRVSVHGGHSGQFCLHASGSLEEIINAYIAHDFSWVGITEHMPPSLDEIVYPEESQAGMSLQSLHQRFALYIKECRRLQKKYSDQITIFVGMETETYPGSEQQVNALLEEFRPDYIVGSVHHVGTIPIDYSQEEYDRAAVTLGGVDQLYCQYFDLQYTMLQQLKPAVVGHFDLIRIFDSDYEERLQKKEITEKIARNLDYIKDYGLILDYNLRSLLKGASEPYVSKNILQMALEREIAIVPGDDSHGIDSIGANIDKAMVTLQTLGFNTKWKRPV
jgi:histidinol-phosphatase (PHP family)